MTEMPRIEASKRERVVQYALGVVFESAWILGLTLLAFAMAAASMWFFSVWGH